MLNTIDLKGKRALITGAAKEVSSRYQLELMIFHKECFGMGKQE